MKRFPIGLLIILLLVPLALASCSPSPQQEAFNACYAEFPEELELDAVGLISILNEISPDKWSLPCQRWVVLVDISAAKAKLEALEDKLAEITKQEEIQANAIKASASTATARAASPTVENTPWIVASPTGTLPVLPTETETPTPVPGS